MKTPLFVFLGRTENSAGRKSVLPARGMIPIAEIKQILRVELFRFPKKQKFTEWNFSAARKDANSPFGMIPFVKNTLRQPSESFRLLTKSNFLKRNDSDWQKYVDLGSGFFLDTENALGRA